MKYYERLRYEYERRYDAAKKAAIVKTISELDQFLTGNVGKALLEFLGTKPDQYIVFGGECLESGGVRFIALGSHGFDLRAGSMFHRLRPIMGTATTKDAVLAAIVDGTPSDRIWDPGDLMNWLYGQAHKLGYCPVPNCP